MPVQRETTLVHGDYRLGNVMLDAADTARIVAVFDWEMATLGDPLTDLAYTVLWWGSVDRPVTHPSQAVADLPGFPSAPELIEQYAAMTGRSCGRDRLVCRDGGVQARGDRRGPAGSPASHRRDDARRHDCSTLGFLGARSV